MCHRRSCRRRRSRSRCSLAGRTLGRLAPIANGWQVRLGSAMRFPSDHGVLADPCHAAGQARSTPLLVQYGTGDCDCLHQDIYGEHVFPPQVIVRLSDPGKDAFWHADATAHHAFGRGSRGPDFGGGDRFRAGRAPRRPHQADISLLVRRASVDAGSAVRVPDQRANSTPRRTRRRVGLQRSPSLAQNLS